MATSSVDSSLAKRQHSHNQSINAYTPDTYNRTLNDINEEIQTLIISENMTECTLSQIQIDAHSNTNVLLSFTQLYYPKSNLPTLQSHTPPLFHWQCLSYDVHLSQYISKHCFNAIQSHLIIDVHSAKLSHSNYVKLYGI